jgi:uncharacterized membrane protein
MKQKIAELINVIFGFRKFILMMILYIVGIVFRILGLLSGAEMVDLFKATTIAFMGANGVEHLVTGVKAVMAGRGVPVPDDNLVPVTEESDEAAVESK